MTTKTTGFKSTEKQREIIQKAAELSGVSVSDFCRSSLANSVRELGMEFPEEDIASRRARIHLDDSSGGIQSVTKLPLNDFYRFFNEETELIRILSTYSLFIAAHSRHLKAAIVNGVTNLECLFLNPQSEITKWRSRGMFQKSNYVKQEINNTLGALTELIESLPEDKQDRVRVRLYDEFPPMRIYAVDSSEVYLGFFTFGNRGMDSPHLHISGKDSEMVRFAEEQFELLWNRSTVWTPSST